MCWRFVRGGRLFQGLVGSGARDGWYWSEAFESLWGRRGGQEGVVSVAGVELVGGDVVGVVDGSIVAAVAVLVAVVVDTSGAEELSIAVGVEIEAVDQLAVSMIAGETVRSSGDIGMAMVVAERNCHSFWEQARYTKMAVADMLDRSWESQVAMAMVAVVDRSSSSIARDLWLHWWPLAVAVVLRIQSDCWHRLA